MGYGYKESVKLFGKEKADKIFDTAGVPKGRVKLSDEEKKDIEYLKMTESAHAKIIHKRLDGLGIKHNHSPNESGQSGSKNIIIMMAKKKAEGTSKGYPDLHILIPFNGGSVQLFIELKKAPGKKGGWNGSTFSEEQADWLNALAKIPCTWTGLCKGSQEVMDLVDAMINNLKDKDINDILYLWTHKKEKDYRDML